MSGQVGRTCSLHFPSTVFFLLLSSSKYALVSLWDRWPLSVGRPLPAVNSFVNRSNRSLRGPSNLLGLIRTMVAIATERNRCLSFKVILQKRSVGIRLSFPLAMALNQTWLPSYSASFPYPVTWKT